MFIHLCIACSLHLSSLNWMINRTAIPRTSEFGDYDCRLNWFKFGWKSQFIFIKNNREKPGTQFVLLFVFIFQVHKYDKQSAIWIWNNIYSFGYSFVRVEIQQYLNLPTSIFSTFLWINNEIQRKFDTHSWSPSFSKLSTGKIEAKKFFSHPKEASNRERSLKSEL